MTGEVHYIRNPAVAATEIDAETFLVEPETGEVFYLDEVTSALWRFLIEPRRDVDIVEAFAEAFPDTATDRIAADIRAALTDMKDRDLVVARTADIP
tara:strand:- start:7990 stop:8280 length:291 start_codon:yes stop_codon:yes gene_type:complete